MTITSEGRLLTPAEVSHILGRSVPALAALRHRGNGPRFLKTGALVRYRMSDLEEWLVEMKQTK